MTTEELKIILEQGEGYNIEFKKDMPSKLRELGEEICAFANAAGGTLLVGVEDNNSIKGIVINNTIRSRVQEAISLIQPRLEVKVTEHQIENKIILCLICKSGNQKPYTISGNIFVRNGPNSEKITSVEQMRDFFQQADKIYFDVAICKKFSYPDDFDQKYFKEFLELTTISNKLPETVLLENLKIYTTDKSFKNAAVLFFAKDVQHFFDHAIIRCVMFKGIDKRYIIDDKTITGNVHQQYNEALKYVISKLNLRYDIESQGGGPRKEILEIPEVVFKEALINALAHRDYFEKGATITVEIFDDRVELSNPGGLVNSIPREEFGTRSFSRNPLVFDLFQRIDLVEKIGSGISRMRDAMIEAKLPEPEFKIEGMFTVIFSRPVDFNRWLDSWKSKLNETRVQILSLIHENSSITKPQLAKYLKISVTAVDNNLNYFKDLGIIERVGSKKLGQWNLVFKRC